MGKLSVLATSFVLAGIAAAEMVRVGEIRTLQYDVSGTVYVVDEDTLKIEDFNYNGKGPDAFFYVGESGGPSGAGTMVPYPEGSDTVLTKADKIDITLRLPTGNSAIQHRFLRSVVQIYFGCQTNDRSGKLQFADYAVTPN